jgi:hypothetical protein
MRTNHVLPPVVLSILFTLAACGEGDAGDGPARVEAPETAVTFEPQSLRDAGCEVLTLEVVADVLGADPQDILQIPMGSSCFYDWNDNKVGLLTLTVLNSAENARSSFIAIHGDHSAEDIARAREALDSAVEERVQQQQMTVEQGETAAGLSGMVADIVATTVHEPIGGIGDRASYDGTVRTMQMPYFGEVVTVESSASVQLGNVLYTIEAHLVPPGGARAPAALPTEEEKNRNRDAALEVARRVEARLRSM